MQNQQKEDGVAFRWIGKSEDGKSVALKHLEFCQITFPKYFSTEWLKENSEIVRKGLILDIETTGLSYQEDVIIELGLRPFWFNRNSGEVLKLGESFTSFQDPGKSLTSEITQITGITDQMVAGKNIDWNLIDSLFQDCSLIIAHNAKFDRPFIDKKVKTSPDKVWACSLKQIDWSIKGFTSPKLELLNIYHGFFTDSHRALNDADALLYILSLLDEKRQTPYLLELLENARRLVTQVIASSAPFESKNQLKARSYNWDNTNRFWTKNIFKDDIASELLWLEENVYHGPFRGIYRDIALTDNFKMDSF